MALHAGKFHCDGMNGNEVIKGSVEEDLGSNSFYNAG